MPVVNLPTDHRFPSSRFRSAWRGRLIRDLCDLAHVAEWEPCNLHGLGGVSWVGSVLYRPCATCHYLDHGLSDPSA